MMSKVREAATQCCHRTALGMAGTAVADGLSLDTILFSGEEKADKVCPVAGGWACRGLGSIEGLLSDE